MLDEPQLQEVERVLGTFCREEPPARVRDALQYVYLIEGQGVVLAERRPAWGVDLGWAVGPVAKFRYTKKRAEWTLYYRDRNLRWHRYELISPAARLATLLAEVKRDPTGIFWG